MNRLKTSDNGGFPFDLDDLRWEQDAIREALEGILSAIGTETTLSGILSGCDNDTVSVTSGFVVIDGEVLYFPGSALPTNTGGPGEVYHFALAVSYDSDGLKTFENGASHDTYEIRRATLVYAVPPTNHVLLASTFLLRGEKYRTLGASGNPSLVNSWLVVPGRPVRFKKGSDKIVRLAGACGNVIANQDQVIFTLPIGYRPDLIRSISVAILQDGTALKHALLEIAPNGDVILNATINTISTGTSCIVYLDEISINIEDNN